MYISGNKGDQMKQIITFIFLISLLLIICSCKKVSQTEYNIDNKACNSCGKCISVCPSDAIEFTSNGKACIDLTNCTQCGKCVAICPQNAIY